MYLTNGKICVMAKLMKNADSQAVLSLANTVNYCEPHELRELIDSGIVEVKFVASHTAVASLTARGRAIVKLMHSLLEDEGYPDEQQSS